MEISAILPSQAGSLIRFSEFTRRAFIKINLGVIPGLMIQGKYVPQKFEDILAEYASGDKWDTTVREVFNYMTGQRLVLDPFGRGAALFECG